MLAVVSQTSAYHADDDEELIDGLCEETDALGGLTVSMSASQSFDPPTLRTRLRLRVIIVDDGRTSETQV